MAFLQVITRTFGARPTLLNRNAQSLAQQSDPDYEHAIILDDKARGVAWANRNLATVAATGEYVWVLDDDDLCCRRHLVAELKEIAALEHPDVIMVRAYHGNFGTLPNDEHWEQAPVLGDVGWSCYVVKAATWDAQRAAIVERYEADYWFIEHLWQTPGLRWYWHDVTAAYYPQQSIGAAENAR